jgi:radical SAM protein with 4Fe4S-binding SPASM domain
MCPHSNPANDGMWGEMDFALVEKAAAELPPNITVIFHHDGEPLEYPRFGEAIRLFKNQIRSMNTNGRLLLERSNDIIGEMDNIAISTFEGDPESEAQYNTVKDFLKLKGSRQPQVIIRHLGRVNSRRQAQFETLGIPVTLRAFRGKGVGVDYHAKSLIPDTGICLDFLSKLLIDHNGYVHICTLFTMDSAGIIGDFRKNTLDEIWNGQIRQAWLKLHRMGKRHMIPRCAACDYHGVPSRV